MWAFFKAPKHRPTHRSSDPWVSTVGAVQKTQLLRFWQRGYDDVIKPEGVIMTSSHLCHDASLSVSSLLYTSGPGLHMQLYGIQPSAQAVKAQALNCFDEQGSNGSSSQAGVQR